MGLIAVFLIYIHAYNQLFGEYGRRDPISRLQGWEQVGKDLEKLAIKYDTKWIATTSYSYTSLISFELRDKIPVIQLTERIRYSMAPEPEESLTGQPGLYVTLLRRDLTHYIKGRFGKFVKVAKLERKVRDTVLDDIVVYYFEEPIENPIGDIDYEAFVSTNLPLSISTNFRNQQPRAYGLNSLTPYTGLNLMEYQVF